LSTQPIAGRTRLSKLGLERLDGRAGCSGLIASGDRLVALGLGGGGGGECLVTSGDRLVPSRLRLVPSGPRLVP
jgi:hypothetical protein